VDHWRPDAQDQRRLALVAGTQENGFSITGMAYANDWHASNQIPERAVSEG